MKSDYIHVKKFISDDVADLLYGHVLLAHRRLSVMLDDKDFYDPNEKMNPTLYGTFDDPQAIGDLSRYGDLIFDTLLLGKTEQLEEITETGLIPQYSYYRLYTKDAELKKHIDRESCEISLTMCLGYDAETSWPIWFKDKDGKEISISLEKGDMVIYRGCDLEHWREPFEGNNIAQVFLHYTKKGGKYENEKYDGRAALGYPK